MGKLVHNIETYALVTLITLLVWLYAEEENVKQYTRTINIQFISPPGQTMALDPVSPQPVEVKYRCSTGQQAALTELTSSPLAIEIAPNEASERQTIALRESIARRLREAGVAIELEEANTPTGKESIEVYAAPLVSLALPVEVRPGKFAMRDVEVQPPKVDVRVPTAMRERAAQSRLYVQLGDVPNISELEPNITHKVSLPLVRPEVLNTWQVGLERASVEVQFTLLQQTDRLTVQSVPILLGNLPPSELGKWTIEIENNARVLPEPVTISGPTDMISKIRNKEIRITAELQFTADELANQITSKAVRMQMPPGVKLESPVPTLRFKITPKS